MEIQFLRDESFNQSFVSFLRLNRKERRGESLETEPSSLGNFRGKSLTLSLCFYSNLVHLIQGFYCVFKAQKVVKSISSFIFKFWPN